MINKINNFFIKNKENSVFILRIGLALVLLWFGIDEILNPENWFGYIPSWIYSILPFSLQTFIFLNGIFEIMIGILLLLGVYTRIVAFIATLYLLVISLSIGYNDIAIRDLGLTMMAISLIFSGAGTFSLDNKIKKKEGF